MQTFKLHNPDNTNYTLWKSFKAIIPNVTIGNDICSEKIDKMNITEPNIVRSRSIFLDLESLHVTKHKLDRINELNVVISISLRTLLVITYNLVYFLKD